MDPEAFFAAEPAPAALDSLEEQMRAFVAQQQAENRRVVLVTSGGTTVPLEKNTVRFVDNFSNGTRGSVSAEEFLKAGYGVIFLHRRFSLMPFERHLNKPGEVMDMFELAPDGRVQMTGAASEGFGEHVRAYQAHRAQLCLVPFVSIADYLFLLRAAGLCLRPLGRRAMVYLAAAVSDFYLSVANMATHKIQSQGGGTGLDLSLAPVPKMLRPLVREWCPRAFVVSFKLETDPDLLVPKARRALDSYGHRLVVANMLQTRGHTVMLVEPAAEPTTLTTLTPEQQSQPDLAALPSNLALEHLIVEALDARHAAFVADDNDPQKDKKA